MKVEIITLDKIKAESLLKGNENNRKKKRYLINDLVFQMKEGLWKENGEGIIVDKDGFLKDGQHRCMAVIEADYSYQCPLISGVDPDVMDTIDTGVNRSLSDILHLDGFLYHSEMAAMIRRIIAFDNGKIREYGSDKDTKYRVSNRMGHQYAHKYKSQLYRLCKSVGRVYGHQVHHILSKSDIGTILYALGGFSYNMEHVDFVGRLTGVEVKAHTPAYWVYKKLAQAKKDKTPIGLKWKVYAAIKAWNLYTVVDEPVNSLRIHTQQPVEKVWTLEETALV